MCLLSDCLLGYWPKLPVIYLEIACCLFTGLCSRATSFSVSREIIAVCTILSDSRAACETSSREIKPLVPSFARLVKLLRAAWETFSRGTELLRAACQGSSRETVCQHFTFSVCFDYLRLERYILWVRYCSLLVNGLEQWHFASLKAWLSHFNQVSSHVSFVLVPWCLSILCVAWIITFGCSSL